MWHLISGLIIGDYDPEEEGFEPRPIEDNEDLINYVEYLLNRKSLETFEDIFQLQFPDKNESTPDTINSCGKNSVVVAVVVVVDKAFRCNEQVTSRQGRSKKNLRYGRSKNLRPFRNFY
jgi:hypothetical protein